MTLQFSIQNFWELDEQLYEKLISTIKQTSQNTLESITSNAQESDIKETPSTPKLQPFTSETFDYWPWGQGMACLLLIYVEGKTVGPMLLEDQIGRGKIHRFDCERIPERVVHAGGAGNHGHFGITDGFAPGYTHAPVLTDTSRTILLFQHRARFSWILSRMFTVSRSSFMSLRPSATLQTFNPFSIGIGIADRL